MKKLLLVVAVLGLGTGRGSAGDPCASISGDSNGDGFIDISDAVYSLSFVFLGGPGPVRFCTATGLKTSLCTSRNGDVNGDGAIDISDAVYSLSFTFQGGPALRPRCPQLRVRKSVTSMSVAERTLFIRTYLEAWMDIPAGETSSQLQQIVQQEQNMFSRGLHNNGAFLPWHRGFVLQVENHLRLYESSVTIPYLDWASEPRIIESSIWGNEEHQFSGSGAANTRCVTEGPFGSNEFQGPTISHSGYLKTDGRCLQRRITGGTAANWPHIEDDLINRYPLPTHYDSFRNRLEHGPGLHDSVHCIVGGTMCSSASANDPIFFLHHAMVDKIWNDWQSQSPEHRDAYTGTTGRNAIMPASSYTPEEMLDLNNLPGPPGGIRVVYEEAND